MFSQKTATDDIHHTHLLPFVTLAALLARLPDLALQVQRTQLVHLGTIATSPHPAVILLAMMSDTSQLMFFKNPPVQRGLMREWGKVIN